MFRNYSGSFNVRLWDGETLTLGCGDPVATIVVHTPKLLRELARRPDPLRLAEAYFIGEIDVDGDLFALLIQSTHLQSLTLSIRDRLSLFSFALLPNRDSAHAPRDSAWARWSKPLRSRLSPKRSTLLNRNAIAFHYDVSNDFYRLWLDEQMVYSCAYFNDPRESLEQAQRSKLDLVCRKLRLRTGERMLDIGCGRGALICWAAHHYGVRAHGITLSCEQYEYTRAGIRDLRLEGQVAIPAPDMQCRNYRRIS